MPRMLVTYSNSTVGAGHWATNNIGNVVVGQLNINGPVFSQAIKEAVGRGLGAATGYLEAKVR